MKKLSMFLAAALSFGAGTLVHHNVAHAQAAGVGQLRGIVKDKGTNEAAIGATVVATSPALQGEQVVITDETGQYFITSLPAGVYTLTVYYNDATFARNNVLVQVGKEAVVNITVNTAESTGKPKGEVITISGTAPIVDQGSTKTGITLTQDYTNNVPTGRTFGATMGAAAGSQGDLYGVSFAGSTSVENTYVIEGINTTDTAYGRLSSNLPNEFISETEVITGGYNAEYGRATGGIVNVVTKSGSNEFHGSVFGNLSPSSFTAAAKTVQAEGGSVDTRTDNGNIWDAGFELGGPIIKDKLWFHVGFDPSVSNIVSTRIVQTQVDKNGDGVPDVDPTTGLTQHEEVSRSTTDGNAKTYYFTAKINGAVDQNNQFQISAFGNPTTGTTPVPTGFTGGPTALDNNAVNRDSGAEDVSAKWTSKLNNGKTQIDAVVGYHHAITHTTSAGGATGENLVIYNYKRSLADFSDIEGPAVAAKCTDGGPNDPYPLIQNCPVTGYTESGLGLLVDDVNDRTTGSLSITQRVKAAGYHVFKAGVDYEGSTYNAAQGYTGGIGYFRAGTPNAAGSSAWSLRNFLTIERNLTDAEIANPSSVTLMPGEEICSSGKALCKQSSTQNADTSDRSIGAYIQDSWQIVPNFTVNVGVRYEQQQAGIAKQLQGTVSPEGETIGDVGFTLNNWAPRVGFVWDPSQEGKSKIFGHWGRFYENIPMDLNVRSLGGEIDNTASINSKHLVEGQQGYDPNCAVNHGSVMGDLGIPLSKCTDYRVVSIAGGGAEFITPGLSGQYSDELIVGAEYEVLPDVKVGINYTHKTLPNVLEDIFLPGSPDYGITNPGQNFDDEADKLLAKSATELMSSDPKVRNQGELDQSRAQGMYRIKTYDKPYRTYDGVQVQLTQRPTKNSLVMASYTYSKEQGNFPGLFSTETGQLDPNITSEYDLPGLLANRYGPMGLDRPHLLKLDGFYRFDLKTAGLITVGASLRAQSGIPHNVLAGDPTYGTGESYLLPRGAFERSPTTGQADIHLAYGYRLSKGTTLEIFGDVFNLTNAQQQDTTDENYTFENARPIVGGDMNDLKHIKTVDDFGTEGNKTPTLNPNFSHTLSYLQAPRSFRFGLRLTF